MYSKTGFFFFISSKLVLKIDQKLVSYLLNALKYQSEPKWLCVTNYADLSQVELDFYDLNKNFFLGYQIQCC